MADKSYKHGPFVHSLNKGGLQQIVMSGKLRGASAGNHMANDRLAVRAYKGSFEQNKKNKRWHGRDKTYIEFMTKLPPRPNLPPGYAEWEGQQLLDNHLPIKILRVVNGEGEDVKLPIKLKP